MIIIRDTATKLQAKLTAVPSAQVPIYVSYGSEPGASSIESFLRNHVAFVLTNSATDVDLLGPPAENETYVVGAIVMTNENAASITAIFKLDDGSDEVELWRGILGANEKVVYISGAGWQVFRASGVLKDAHWAGATGATNGTTDVITATGPCKVTRLTLFNSDTAAKTFIVMLDDGSQRTIWRGELVVNEAFILTGPFNLETADWDLVVKLSAAKTTTDCQWTVSYDR